MRSSRKNALPLRVAIRALHAYRRFRRTFLPPHRPCKALSTNAIAEAIISNANQLRLGVRIAVIAAQYFPAHILRVLIRAGLARIVSKQTAPASPLLRFVLIVAGIFHQVLERPIWAALESSVSLGAFSQIRTVHPFWCIGSNSVGGGAGVGFSRLNFRNRPRS